MAGACVRAPVTATHGGDRSFAVARYQGNVDVFQLAENAANNLVVGTVTMSDPDAATVLSWAITAGNTGGAFSIDRAGQIHVANSGALDFETTPTFGLTVQATDNGSPVLSGSATITVNLTNVNEAPVASPATFTLAENSVNDAIVGTVAVADRDAGTIFSWAITGGNAAGAFAIDSGGQIRVASSGALDFETTPTFNLTVQATDNGSPALSSSATITVNLTDLDEIRPTVDIVDIAPDPGTSPINSISVVFSEPVTGLDVSDLDLTRDGERQSAAGAATLSATDQITWTLSGLSSLTSGAGVYLLKIAAAGSGIVDAASNALIDDAVDVFSIQATVVGRHIFYNNSAFDGNNSNFNSGDDGAGGLRQECLAARPDRLIQQLHQLQPRHQWCHARHPGPGDYTGGQSFHVPHGQR